MNKKMAYSGCIDPIQGKLISDLKFLNSVTPNTKISFKNRTILPDDWFTYFMRRFGRENYLTTISEIEGIIFGAIREYTCETTNVAVRNAILTELKVAQKSLNTLMDTYKNIDFNSKVEVIKLNIENVLEEDRKNEHDQDKRYSKERSRNNSENESPRVES